MLPSFDSKKVPRQQDSGNHEMETLSMKGESKRSQAAVAEWSYDLPKSPYKLSKLTSVPSAGLARNSEPSTQQEIEAKNVYRNYLNVGPTSPPVQPKAQYLIPHQNKDYQHAVL